MAHRFLLAAITVFILGSSSATEAAADPPVFRGVVRDTSGGAIAGATVQLQAGGIVIAEAGSSWNGGFVLQLNAAGLSARPDREMMLSVFSDGFAPYRASFQVDAPQPLSLTLQMAPYRQVIEVSTALPAHRTILDLSGLRESAARDVGEALSSLEGFTKLRKAGIANDVVVRGFQSGNLNVLVDGTRTFGACPGHMDPPIQHVDFAEVERVEVTKGAFDVANQGSLGALVNVVRKTPGIGFAFRPAFSTGSWGFVNPSATLSYGTQALRLLAGYSYRASDPYTDGSGRPITGLLAYTAAARRGRAFDIHTGWFDAHLNLSPRQTLALSYARQQAGLILYPYLAMDGDYDNLDRATVRYEAHGLSSSIKTLRVTGFHTQVQHFMSNSQRGMAVNNQWTMGSEASSRSDGGRLEFDIGSSLTVGGESYYRNWNVTRFTFAQGLLSGMSNLPNVDNYVSGAFAQYRRRLTERLLLNTGVRFDSSRQAPGIPGFSTDNYFRFQNTRNTVVRDRYGSANAHFTWALPASVELFSGLGSTGRVPDGAERFFSRGMGQGAWVGNPRLPVTRNTEVAAGMRWNRSRFYLRPSFFYSFLDDFIMIVNQPQQNASSTAMGSAATVTAKSYTNTAARMYGGEASYGATLTSWLSLAGGTAYTRGRTDIKPQAGVRNPNLPEMPPLRSWASLRWLHRIAFAEFGANGVDRQSSVNTDLQELETPGYATLNAKFGFTFRRASFSFTLDNLTDRYYYEHLSYQRDPFTSGLKVPEPGRNFFVQVRYSF